MDKKEMLMMVNDELGIVLALLKTVNMAVGNREYLGDDGQGIAITLDIISARLQECRRSLCSLDKGQEDI